MTKGELITPSDLVVEVPEEVHRLLLPSIVAIYAITNGKPDQIGSGFLTLWNSRPTLVTAKHVLYGHQFDEEPLEKHVFANGELVSLWEIALSNVAADTDLDVAVVHLDRFETSRCLMYTALRPNDPKPAIVTIAGYLSRDFRRNADEEKLAPKPFCYTNKAVDADSQRLAVLYTNRGINTNSGHRELTPIPRGLSGTAMVSTAGLSLQEVKVVGVFTDERLSESYVFGTHISAAMQLFDRLKMK